MVLYFLRDTFDDLDKISVLRLQMEISSLLVTSSSPPPLPGVWGALRGALRALAQIDPSSGQAWPPKDWVPWMPPWS